LGEHLSTLCLLAPLSDVGRVGGRVGSSDIAYRFISRRLFVSWRGEEGEKGEGMIRMGYDACSCSCINSCKTMSVNEGRPAYDLHDEWNGIS
jgi:hypothetical protein